jgi:hypothetical protein
MEASLKCARCAMDSKHLQLDHAIFDLAACDARPGGKLERGSMLLQIAEGLIFGAEGRLQAASLPGRSDCQDKGDALAPARLGLGRNSNTLVHAEFSGAAYPIGPQCTPGRWKSMGAYASNQR